MQKYLSHLALIDLNNFCEKHNIDISGSHLEKKPRKQIYNLIKDETGKILASVQFHTSQAPAHQL